MVCQLLCEHTSNRQVTDACSFFYSLFIICINTTVNKVTFIVREIPNKYINISIKSINTTSILTAIAMHFGWQTTSAYYHFLLRHFTTIFFKSPLILIYKFRQNIYFSTNPQPFIISHLCKFVNLTTPKMCN